MEASKSKLNEFRTIIEKGQSLGLNMTDIVEKFEAATIRSKDDVIRIVMLGAFSDGKTSVVAGMLGQVWNDMKFDIEESTDELTIYRDPGKKFEIVDTPGLFGSKTKEVDGKEVRYSEITEKYISEAHIVIYVTDSVNPLKESHSNMLKLVLRKFNELGVSIFVINKMDEAGVDMSDEEDYEEAAKIKRKTFIDRLDRTISLTEKERKELRVVCIASDPYQKGLDKWLQNEDEYIKNSHVNLLRDLVTEIINNANEEDLKIQVDISVLKDLVMQLAKQIALLFKELEDPLLNIKNELKELDQRLMILRNDLAKNRETMTSQIETLKNSLLLDVDKSNTLQEFAQFIETEIGVQNDKVTSYIFERKINQILSSCTESNNSSIFTRKDEFENSFNQTDGFLKSEVLKAAKFAGNLKIDAEMVKWARDIFAKGYKFKPYGAIKMGKNISKGLKYIEYGVQALDWAMKYWNAKKLERGKKDIKNNLNDCFAEIYSLFNQDEEYYKNFAPTFIELRKQIDKRKNTLTQLEQRNQNIIIYKSDVEKWYGRDIEDVEYEEV